MGSGTVSAQYRYSSWRQGLWLLRHVVASVSSRLFAQFFSQLVHEAVSVFISIRESLYCSLTRVFTNDQSQTYPYIIQVRDDTEKTIIWEP